jgi:hypothetical protein
MCILRFTKNEVPLLNYFNSVIVDQERQIERERKELEKLIEKTSGKVGDQKKVLPSVFAESVYLLDGRRFRLTDRDYLKAIYDLPIEEGLLMCGRQVEKSTTFSVKISNTTLLMNFYRALYFAPTNDQVKVFSEDRLGRLFKYSQEDIIKKEYMTYQDKQNVFNKSFSTVGSLIYLRHAYGLGDNIRGISANGVYGDEIQDVVVDALPVIGETQAHARDLGPCVKHTWYSGTPKTYSNTIQQLWDRTNQSEWVVRCLRCGCDQILGEKNLTPTKYVCRKCGKELTRSNISKNGQWVKMNRTSKMYGFRISQMVSPSVSPADVWQKTLNYPKSKLFNEVFGRSFEHADKPLTRPVLMRLVDSSLFLAERREPPFMSMPITMGIDWGHGTSSYTIVTVRTRMPGTDKDVILHTKKFKVGDELLVEEYQIPYIHRLVENFGVNYILADYGDGFTQGQILKSYYGAGFDMVFYSPLQKKLIDYTAENNFWTVARDRILFLYVTHLRKQKDIWPGGDMEGIMHMIEDHEVVQLEYRSTSVKSPEGNMAESGSSRMMFTHPLGTTDDSFHSSFLSWFALKWFLSEPIDPNMAVSANELVATATAGRGMENGEYY